MRLKLGRGDANVINSESSIRLVSVLIMMQLKMRNKCQNKVVERTMKLKVTTKVRLEFVVTIS